MQRNFRRYQEHAIGTTVLLVAIIVVILVAVAGVYAYSSLKSSTSTQTTSTQTTTSSIASSSTQITTSSSIIASSSTPSLSTSSSSSVTSSSSSTTSSSTSTTQSTTSSSTVAKSNVAFSFAYNPTDPNSVDVIYANANSQTYLPTYTPNLAFTPFSSGTSAIISCVVNGQCGMGETLTDNIGSAISTGAPIQIVAELISEGGSYSVAVSTKSNITNINQLEGQTFAAPSKGSGPDIQAHYLDAQFGWGTNFKEAFYSTPAAAYAAVASGSATASVATIANYFPYISSGQLKIIYNYTTTWPLSAIFASNTFITQHPDAVSAAIQMLMNVNSYAINQNNKPQMLQFIQTTFNYTSSQASTLYSTLGYSTNGAIYPNQLQNGINAWALAGVVSSSFAVTSLYSTQFVQIIQTTSTTSGQSAGQTGISDVVEKL